MSGIGWARGPARPRSPLRVGILGTWHIGCMVFGSGCLYLPAPWSPDVNLAPTLEQPDLSRCDERVVDEQWSCDLVLDADPVVLVVLAHDPDARDDSEGDTAEPDPCDVCFHWAPDDIVTDIRSGNLPDGRYSSTVSVAAETRLHNRRLFLDVTDGPNNLAIDWRICHPAVDPGGCLGVK